MAQATGLLLEGKPIIEIAIADALPTPRSVGPSLDANPLPLRHYRALIDTGADITCLCDRVVREARLAPYGMIKMTGGNGPSIHRTFIVQIGVWCGELGEFEGDGQVTKTLFQLDGLEAAEIRDNQWFDVIIGTDVLVRYDFHLKRGGEFTLTLN
jgi:hypothetical protein